MQITEEVVTCMLDDQGNLIAVARRNGHVLTYETKEVGMDKYTKLLKTLTGQTKYEIQQ